MTIYHYLHEGDVGRFSRLGRVDHEVHQSLTRDGGTQSDRHQLRELGLHLRVHINHLHVTPTETTPSRQEKRERNQRLRRHNCTISTGLPISILVEVVRSYNG